MQAPPGPMNPYPNPPGGYAPQQPGNPGMPPGPGTPPPGSPPAAPPPSDSAIKNAKIARGCGGAGCGCGLLLLIVGGVLLAFGMQRATQEAMPFAIIVLGLMPFAVIIGGALLAWGMMTLKKLTGK